MWLAAERSAVTGAVLQQSGGGESAVLLSGVAGELAMPVVSSGGGWRAVLELLPGVSGVPLGNGVAAVWRSPDGVSWERVGLPVGWVSGNGQVAFGVDDDGSLLLSLPGTMWTYRDGVDSLPDPSAFMSKHSQLWGGTPDHGLDYITRGTQYGTQHYFSPDAFASATWIRSSMSRYELRVLLWSWGLLVDLDLSVHASDTEPIGGVPIARKVWLVVTSTTNVWDDEMPRLVSGLRRVAQRVRAAKAYSDQELVFVLDHLWYPPTGFQEDALELAVAGWAVEELGLLDAPAAISFDRANNRYSIEFNEELWEVTP